MQIRPFRETDLERIRALHAKQQFAYPMPDLTDPVFALGIVAEDGEAQMAAFETAQNTRDKKIDADARAAVRKEIDDENAATVQTTNKVKVYEQALPILPPTDTICRVGNDADKLRVIAGAPPSQRKLRMPALRRKRTGA